MKWILPKIESAADPVPRVQRGEAVELYEIVCELNRHGFFLPVRPYSHVPRNREREGPREHKIRRNPRWPRGSGDARGL
jgi:hypothetical protein